MTSRPIGQAAAPTRPERILMHEAVPFIAVHLLCLAAIWTGVHTVDLVIAAALYAVRMFAVTAGHHRYFSHRSFKTSRWFQFVLAFLAQTSAQRGVLWWAQKHRHHHRYSDADEDVHSPIRRRFLYAHLGWIFSDRHDETDLKTVPDLARFPELVWLDRHPYLPAIVLGTAVWLFAGWSGLVVGFFWSTVAVWHGTFSINSLAHVLGRRRYVTGDQSRNNWWLALITFGEGWHNNHHHFQSAARQGFRWYEVDLTYYVLKGLSSVGLVWDLVAPPAPVVRNEQRLGRITVEKAAAQLVDSFAPERIAADLRTTLARAPQRLNLSGLELPQDPSALVERWRQQLDEGLENVRHEVNQLIDAIGYPTVPTLAELRARAGNMFVRTVSMEDIVERAWQMLVDGVCVELVRPVSAPAAANG